VTNSWTLRSYDEVRIGSGLSNAGNAAYVDNVKVWISGGTMSDRTGDYNQSGVVDGADYVMWRKNVGTQNLLPNDPVGGTIGSQQYTNWFANFGRGTLSAAATRAAVPEPSGFVLFLSAIAMVACKRPVESGAKTCTAILGSG